VPVCLARVVNLGRGWGLPQVAQNFSKRCSKSAPKRSKVAFCDGSCSKVAKKAKSFVLSLLLFGLVQKYANVQ